MAESITSRYLPYAIGGVTALLLSGLGFWQLARGLDKRAGVEAFEAADGYERYRPGMQTRGFQQLTVAGRYKDGRQILIDNMIHDGRRGHYVITALELSDSEPLLLVNRGWLPVGEADDDALAIDAAGPRQLAGRVGRLPKAGMQMGPGFENAGDWPKHAVFPTADEVAAELGREVLPFVLLLDADQPGGFVRDWSPESMTASRHFGYAFQWFAMTVTLSGLLIWRFNRRKTA